MFLSTQSAGFTNAKSAPFNGTTSSISVGSTINAALTAASAFSLSAWVKPTSQPGSAALFDNMVTGSGYRGVLLSLYGNGGVQFQFSNGAGSVPYMRTATGTVPNSAWAHIVVTYSGSGNVATGTVIYVNGTSISFSPVGSTVSGNTTSTGPLKLGGETGAGNGYFNGLFDEPSIWSKGLSQSEVTELYLSGHAGDLLSHSAFASAPHWWRFGDKDDTTSTTFDQIGSANGTISNIAAFSSDVP